ncbi:MAG: alpha/beta hydrolase family protein [Armatimonadota bacterium]
MSGKTLWSFYTDEAQRQLEAATADFTTAQAWEAQRPELYRQYMRSMGLDPLPARCELAVQTRGEFSGQGYRASSQAWQILPDCWASGQLYLPDPLPTGKLPGVLYVCGHHLIGIHGYQDHAMTWARRGYACLVVDTVEQHDSRGDHHGLWSGRRPDWISLGYTAAGGELWNSMRALDVLAMRPEVDADRLGTTGISGGGGASFFLAMADPRIKALASVAGISTPAYAIRDRFLQGHCDCIYLHNYFGHDISKFAGLLAPRASLYAFARHDPLYIIEEFRGLAERTGRVYQLLGRNEQFSFFEYDGPHAYQPETIETIQRWFDRHLAGEEHPIITERKREHSETVVTVFNGTPPSPQRMDLLPELLTPEGRVPLPRTAEEWPAIRNDALSGLRQHVFMRVHEDPPRNCRFEPVGNWILGEGIKRKYRAESDGMDLMMMITAGPADYDRVVVSVAGPGEEIRGTVDRVFSQLGQELAMLAVEPRGSGFTSLHPAHERQLLRAGALVGLTPNMLVIQDLWRLMPHLHALPEVEGRQVFLHGRGDMAVACLYHALFDPRVAGVLLEDLPLSHRDGGYILGILRCLDIPEAVGLMAPRPVGITYAMPAFFRWIWPQRAYDRLGKPDALIIGESISRVTEQVFAVAGGVHA